MTFFTSSILVNDWHMAQLPACFVDPFFAVGRSASLTWFFGHFHLLGRFLPANDSCGILVDMSEQFIGQVILHQGIMRLCTKVTASKLCECTGKCGFRGGGAPWLKIHRYASDS